jgi:hypothetical protein
MVEKKVKDVPKIKPENKLTPVDRFLLSVVSSGNIEAVRNIAQTLIKKFIKNYYDKDLKDFINPEHNEACRKEVKEYFRLYLLKGGLVKEQVEFLNKVIDSIVFEPGSEDNFDHRMPAIAAKGNIHLPYRMYREVKRLDAELKKATDKDGQEYKDNLSEMRSYLTIFFHEYRHLLSQAEYQSSEGLDEEVSDILGPRDAPSLIAEIGKTIALDSTLSLFNQIYSLKQKEPFMTKRYAEYAAAYYLDSEFRSNDEIKSVAYQIAKLSEYSGKFMEEDIPYFLTQIGYAIGNSEVNQIIPNSFVKKIFSIYDLAKSSDIEVDKIQIFSLMYFKLASKDASERNRFQEKKKMLEGLIREYLGEEAGSQEGLINRLKDISPDFAYDTVLKSLELDTEKKRKLEIWLNSDVSVIGFLPK